MGPFRTVTKLLSTGDYLNKAIVLRPKYPIFAACASCRELQTTVIKPIVPQPQLAKVTTHSQKNHVSTGPVRLGMMSQLKESLGLPSKMKYSKAKLKWAGLRLYLCCVELVDADEFFKEFALPDTFSAYFKITELHIWMAMVRLAMEGKEGKYLTQQLVGNLWKDMEKRSSKLGGTINTARKEGIMNLNYEFRSALFAYDEGSLDHDRVLAGALWRNFFGMNCDNPEHLETLVAYVRKQMAYIEKQDSDVILRSGLMTWLPLHGISENKQRTDSILKNIVERV